MDKKKMEKIGKVNLNYSFYNGIDEYSDGDIEETLLDIVKNEKNRDKAIHEASDFAIYYHLAKERENIIEPMHLTAEDAVLEIGAGCGAISGAIAKRVNLLDAIDLSRRRSMINAHKNKECENLTIYVGNYADIILQKKYDVITLIGVLEYANYYVSTMNPYVDLLKKTKEQLSQKGRIYIAIENRLGAKYFSGCKEDHTDTRFEGVLGYPRSVRVRTFSYFELMDIFNASGLEVEMFYYPYPDYKFPRCFFTDYFLPNKDEPMELSSEYSSARRVFFDETVFLKTLHREEYKIFANSYLICLRRKV